MTRCSLSLSLSLSQTHILTRTHELERVVELLHDGGQVHGEHLLQRLHGLLINLETGYAVKNNK